MAAAVVALAALSATLGLAAGGAAPAPQQAEDRFLLGGKPIHPLSVAPLIEDLGGHGPRIAAVDLEGSRASGSHSPKVTVRGETVSSLDGEGGWVAYRHVGTTPNGLHVLRIEISGGGSGIFGNVAWVRLARDQVWEDGKKRGRTTLVLVGEFTLGDRDNGEVRLDGAKLFVGRSRYRDEDVTIPLE